MGSSFIHDNEFSYLILDSPLYCCNLFITGGSIVLRNITAARQSVTSEIGRVKKLRKLSSEISIGPPPAEMSVSPNV